MEAGEMMKLMSVISELTHLILSPGVMSETLFR